MKEKSTKTPLYVKVSISGNESRDARESVESAKESQAYEHHNRHGHSF
jgi:hypothetical protein